MTTFGPIGTVFFSAKDFRTAENPRGYYPQFLADKDGFGDQLIKRALAHDGKILCLYDVEGQENDLTAYVGYPLVAPQWMKDWLKGSFAPKVKAAGLKLQFLLRHYFPADGIQIPMGVACIADGLLFKYQQVRWWLGYPLYDVLAGFQYDDNYLPENTAVPVQCLADFQRRLPGGPCLITTEIYGPGYETVGAVPYRWGGIQPDRPFKELVIPGPLKDEQGLPLSPGKTLVTRVAEFKHGDECAFTAHYDSPVDAENLKAWRAAQAQSK